ncbi:hypothetical protein H0H87_000849 [Tephrocybe sp. NHM501043]|nr:hypothetical protein H0H87_000849 [Tephrocybe sp. NHM501043]
MVGFGMILDSQEGEDFAIHKVRRFEDQTANRISDVEPPPYTEPPLSPVLPHRVASSSHSARILVDEFDDSNKSMGPSRSKLLPRPSVSQVHMQERNTPISGTFYVDPRIPSLGFDARGDKARKKNPPHASFRARNADISLELGTTGDIDVAHPKAKVLVTTRHGNVNVKMVSK